MERVRMGSSTLVAPGVIFAKKRNVTALDIEREFLFTICSMNKNRFQNFNFDDS